jgi:predicted transcriptional regulator
VTTITAQLDPDLAKRVAKAADILRMTHEQIATEAIRLFVRSVSPELRQPRRKGKR